MGMRKYAQLIPAKVRPARAITAQNAIINSPSFFFAFFTAKEIARHPISKANVERIPKMIRSKLSGMIKSIYQKEAANAKTESKSHNGLA
jgi:hypothetical protein